MELPKQTGPIVLGNARQQAFAARQPIIVITEGLCCDCVCFGGWCLCRCVPCPIIILCW